MNNTHIRLGEVMLGEPFKYNNVLFMPTYYNLKSDKIWGFDMVTLEPACITNFSTKLNSQIRKVFVKNLL